MIRALAILAAGLALAACAGSGVEVSANDARLEQTGPVMQLNGKAYTGNLVERDAADHILSRKPYQDGRLNGISREWYVDGRLRSERHYVAGHKEGLHRGWWPDGHMQFEYWFVNGEYAGLARTWYESGKRFEEHRYHAGHESGLQQLWYPDGSLRASYEVRDGHRYGTIGSKPCISKEKKIVLTGGLS